MSRGPSWPLVRRDAALYEPAPGDIHGHSRASGEIPGFAVSRAVRPVIFAHPGAVALARLSAPEFAHSLPMKRAPSADSCEGGGWGVDAGGSLRGH